MLYGLTILNYDSKKEEFLIPKTMIRYEVVPNVTWQDGYEWGCSEICPAGWLLMGGIPNVP
jgi:hypothetical protein